MGRIELELSGTSLRGFRFFVALVEGFVVLSAGLAAPRTRRQAGGTVCGSSGSGHSRSLVVRGLILVLLILRLLMLGAGGLLRNLLAQVGGSALVGCYRGRDRREHDDQVHDGFPFLGVVGGLLLTPDRRYLKRRGSGRVWWLPA